MPGTDLSTRNKSVNKSDIHAHPNGTYILPVKKR